MYRPLGMLGLTIVLICSLSSSVFANCTLGYFKTHPQDWCIGTLQIGDVLYDQEELLSILWQEVEGNGLVSLAHQLIAAKLNVSCGAGQIDCIDAADALIGALVIPPVGTGYLDPSQTSALVECLTDFNETPGGNEVCDAIPVDDSTWGRIKATYR